MCRTRHTPGLNREFGHDGLHEVRSRGARGDDLSVQLVHQGHQLLHFGHDPALFGEGWHWNRRLLDHSNVQRRLCERSRGRGEVVLNRFLLENEQEVIAENAKLARQLEELDKEYKEVKAKVEQTRAQMQSEKQKGVQMRGQVEDKRELVNGVRQSYEGALVERVA